ncbi:MAG TPA: hypothetical protein VGL54_01545 [Solirubrobacteraceae bacterium]|jgi:hypothetical protein
MKIHLGHLTHIRKQVITIALMASLTTLGLASPALAKEPTGDFAVFKQCPRFTEGVNLCLYSQTNSGEVTLNKQTVPITNPITLQGGIIFNEETEAEMFVGALNGETLSKSPQPVPGGLAGLIKCNEITEPVAKFACELVFQNGLTGVNATTELAKPASEIGINTNNLVNREGIALSLPVKIRLENPLLGGACYIGSSSSPITWNLTTGTTSPPPPNKPINGKVGKLEFKDEGSFIEITNNTLVDNSFSAPGASGCGGLLAPVVDPLIDAKIGLPSAAGQNTAILNNIIKQATAGAVIASEE